jgi:hypothetical protein
MSGHQQIRLRGDVRLLVFFTRLLMPRVLCSAAWYPVQSLLMPRVLCSAAWYPVQSSVSY